MTRAKKGYRSSRQLLQYLELEPNDADSLPYVTYVETAIDD